MKNHIKISLISSLYLLITLTGCDWCTCMKKEEKTTEPKIEAKKEETTKTPEVAKTMPEPKPVIPEAPKMMMPEPKPSMPEAPKMMMPEPKPVIPEAPKMMMPEPQPIIPMPVAPKMP